MIHHPTTESVYSWRPQRQCCCLGMAVLSFAVLVFFSPANHVLALGRCAGREHSGVFMSTDTATCWAMRRLNTWEITGSNPNGEPGDPDSYLHTQQTTEVYMVSVSVAKAGSLHIRKFINGYIILSVSIRKQRRTEEQKKRRAWEERALIKIHQFIDKNKEKNNYWTQLMPIVSKYKKKWNGCVLL